MLNGLPQAGSLCLTSGWVLMLESWKSKRQPVVAETVALSSAEAKFIAASALVQEVMYTRRLLENLGFPQTDPTCIYEDNQTCIAWSEGSVGGTAGTGPSTSTFESIFCMMQYRPRL